MLIAYRWHNTGFSQLEWTKTLILNCLQVLFQMHLTNSWVLFCICGQVLSLYLNQFEKKLYQKPMFLSFVWCCIATTSPINHFRHSIDLFDATFYKKQRRFSILFMTIVLYNFFLYVLMQFNCYKQMNTSRKWWSISI